MVKNHAAIAAQRAYVEQRLAETEQRNQEQAEQIAAMAPTPTQAENDARARRVPAPAPAAIVEVAKQQETKPEVVTEPDELKVDRATEASPVQDRGKYNTRTSRPGN